MSKTLSHQGFYSPRMFILICLFVSLCLEVTLQLNTKVNHLSNSSFELLLLFLLLFILQSLCFLPGFLFISHISKWVVEQFGDAQQFTGFSFPLKVYSNASPRRDYRVQSVPFFFYLGCDNFNTDY